MNKAYRKICPGDKEEQWVNQLTRMEKIIINKGIGSFKTLTNPYKQTGDGPHMHRVCLISERILMTN